MVGRWHGLRIAEDVSGVQQSGFFRCVLGDDFDNADDAGAGVGSGALDTSSV